MNINLATVDGAEIATALEAGYQAVATMVSSNLETPVQLVRNRLADAVVIDDRLGTAEALLTLVDAALGAGASVFAILKGPGQPLRQVLEDRGVWITQETRPELLVRWVAHTLALSARAYSNSAIIATASAKGGASKTTLACLLAEACAFRGEKVLMWEADLSNAAIRQHYGFGSDARPYTELANPLDRRGWTSDSVGSYIAHRQVAIRGRSVELSFLLGPASAASLQDLERHHWNALHEVVRQLPYTVVIVDTGPEILRRPTALHVLDAGGYVLIPCPTGVLEREGAANLLTTIREWNTESLNNCGLVFVEPEVNAISLHDLPAIRQLAQRNFAAVQQLGLLPRDARAISSAAQLLIEQGTYSSVLDIAPHSPLAQSVWSLTDALGELIGRPMAASAPTDSWFNRWFKRKRILGFNTLQVAMQQRGRP